MSSPDRSLADRRREAERVLNAGDSRLAETILDAVVTAAPEDARAWHLLGTARYRNGELASAAEAFTRRLNLVPHDAVAHYSIAVALRGLGRVDEAREHLSKAVRLRPDFSQARNRLAELEAPLGSGPASRSPTRPDPPPLHPARADSGLVGRARHIQRTSEQDPWTRSTVQTWSLRVERTDDAGNTLAPVPVQIRGARIEGAVSDGDWLELRGPWRPGQTFRVRWPKQVRNLTTYERLRNRPRWLLRLLLVGIVAGAVAFVVLWVRTGTSIFADATANIPTVSVPPGQDGGRSSIPDQNPPAVASPPSPPHVEIVTIPDVRGDPGGDAKERLEGLGLVVEVVEQASPDVPVGVVVDTDPAAGQTVVRGSAVALTVSSGEASVEPTVHLPDVVGRSQADAKSELSAAGFVVERRDAAVPAPGPEFTGTVESQDPAGGGELAPGSTVTIFVYPEEQTSS